MFISIVLISGNIFSTCNACQCERISTTDDLIKIKRDNKRENRDELESFCAVLKLSDRTWAGYAAHKGKNMIRFFELNSEGITAGTELVRQYLAKKGIGEKEQSKAVLIAEESLTDLVAHSSGKGKLEVSVYSFFGPVNAFFSAKGPEYDFETAQDAHLTEFWDDEDFDSGDAIRQLILQSFRKDLKYQHRYGRNIVHLTVEHHTKSLYLTLGALIAAILLGIIMSAALPGKWNTALDLNLLTPVKTLYMNALKMIAAPVVFFSIISCISQLGSPSEFGRIGGKILALYLITSIIAAVLGIIVFGIFRPGDPALASSFIGAEVSVATQSLNLSLKDIIVGIVPTNFIGPFIEGNMLQLLFEAILCGIAAGLIGERSRVLKELFEACNELFLRITGIIMKVTPLAVFCSILSLVLKTGISSLLSLLGIMGTFLFGLVCMMLVYFLILFLVKLNPLSFFKKYFPVMLEVFSIASSNAAIPINMDACRDRLGVSPKIYRMSIPLGATLNMDGTCILLGVQTLALAKICGVSASAGMLVSLAATIVILSLGAPGVPGSGVILTSFLLTQLNVPVESVTLVIGIGPIIGMFICMSNCLGDAVVTTVVAKNEGQIDLNILNSK